MLATVDMVSVAGRISGNKGHRRSTFGLMWADHQLLQQFTWPRQVLVRFVWRGTPDAPAYVEYLPLHRDRICATAWLGKVLS